MSKTGTNNVTTSPPPVEPPASKRLPALKIYQVKDNVRHIGPAPGEDETALRRHLAAFGTENPIFSGQVLSDIVNAGKDLANVEAGEHAANVGQLMMNALAPRDETEAMLCCQMVAVHQTAMDLIGRGRRGETVHAFDWCRLADRLLRTYAIQLDTLKRWRSKGEQRVKVEHVHVNEGGQAIVGAVDVTRNRGEG